jgi:cytochrome c-type biogenesis protein CcmE
MKKIIAISTLALASLALAAVTLTPSDVLKSTAKFDKKVIKVSGVVKKFQAKTSKSGSEYFMLDLTSGKDKISVFGHGKPEKPLKDGDKIEVEGKFEKEKVLYKGQPHERIFKNELDCSGKKGEKPHLKVIK